MNCWIDGQDCPSKVRSDLEMEILDAGICECCPKIYSYKKDIEGFFFALIGKTKENWIDEECVFRVETQGFVGENAHIIYSVFEILKSFLDNQSSIFLEKVSKCKTVSEITDLVHQNKEIILMSSDEDDLEALLEILNSKKGEIEIYRSFQERCEEVFAEDSFCNHQVFSDIVEVFRSIDQYVLSK